MIFGWKNWKSYLADAGFYLFVNLGLQLGNCIQHLLFYLIDIIVKLLYNFCLTKRRKNIHFL
jgi:hypothetical protein